MLDAKIPAGRLEEKWGYYRSTAKLVSAANRKKLKVIIVGTGLAGSSLGASLGEMGYQVACFCFQDSARRAHSVAAQGGVNACKNYKNDGDTIFRMFYDTIKGGDFRSREANVYRLAECSASLIDQAVAQGVPFAREYSGYLSNRSFGGVQVSRTFYARGQTGQQLLLGAYQALMRQVAAGTVALFTRHEMLDLVTIDGKARGIIVRNLDNGAIERHAGHAVVLASGGFGKIYYLSTLAMGCNASAIWRAHKRGAYFANPSWTQIHPTCLPQSGDYQSKLTLMSESLRNDGRIWVPKNREERHAPNDIPESDRDYYLERRYPAFGNLSPRDISSRAAKGENRRRLRSRTSKERRLSRFFQSHRRTRKTEDRRKVWKPFPDVSKDYWGKRLRRTNAHIAGRAFFDGRLVGGLRTHDHHSRALRCGRGQFCRSRGKPVGS